MENREEKERGWKLEVGRKGKDTDMYVHDPLLSNGPNAASS